MSGVPSFLTGPVLGVLSLFKEDCTMASLSLVTLNLLSGVPAFVSGRPSSSLPRDWRFVLNLMSALPSFFTAGLRPRLLTLNRISGEWSLFCRPNNRLFSLNLMSGVPSFLWPLLGVCTAGISDLGNSNFDVRNSGVRSLAIASSKPYWLG